MRTHTEQQELYDEIWDMLMSHKISTGEARHVLWLAILSTYTNELDTGFISDDVLASWHKESGIAYEYLIGKISRR